MIEIKAPGDYSAYSDKKAVFLAGSIEMGKAERWQDDVAEKLKDEDILILNPRRSHWNAKLEQSIDNAEFREQVEWELKALERADQVLMYFAPDTMAPITLLEFGLWAKSAPEKLVVCCPDGYWRKGNIDVTSKMYGVCQVGSLDELVKGLTVNL